MYEREEVEDRDPCPPDNLPAVSPLRRCRVVRNDGSERIVYGFVTTNGLLCCDTGVVYPSFEFAPYHYARS